MLGSTSELTSALVDQLDHGVWQLHASDGCIQATNAAAAEQIGSIHPLSGLPIGEMMVPPMSPEGWRLLVDHIPSSGTHRLMVSLQRADATVTEVEMTLSRHRTTKPDEQPAVGPEHEVVLALTRSISTDLPGGSDKLNRTLSALSDGIALIALDGRIESTNPAFGQLLDVAADELVGRSIFDPPWQLVDEHGAALPPESNPAIATLRTGRSVPPLVVCSPGRGLSRPVDRLSWLELTSEPLRDVSGATEGAVLSVRDVTALLDLRARLSDAVQRDSLTGLATRAHVVATLEEQLDAARDEPGRRIGVLHVDLDSFRSVNDTFGSTIGDHVLRTISERLADLADRHVVIGRISVDEFLVVVSGDDPASTFDARLRRLADEIQRRIERQLVVDSLELRLTASVGVSRWPGDGDDAPSLQRAADRALTAGRRDGRQQVRFYERVLDEHTRTGLALDRDLRRAAAQRGMDVHFQPIIDLRTGEIAAAEALVRWHHPEHGPIPPSVFIPTAEATGAISAISDLVMTTVAENLAMWNADSLLPQGARIAVNISAAEFARRGFVERLDATLKNAGVSPTQIELEITETLLMNDIETTASRLTSLDKLGFLVALDDFGTGYSSLSYLHSLPLHTLKVDRCFVGDLHDGRSETITRAILSLAHGLGIVAVGEGVETEEQRRFLLDAGCDLVQGYFFAPPLPRTAFETFLREHREDRRGAGPAGVLDLQTT